MKSYTVTANGIRQFVVEEGEGAPVILLHGFQKQTMPGGTRYPFCPDTIV